MRILHAFNRHRSGGGSDNAWDETIRISRLRGLEVFLFERDSRQLSSDLCGKTKAALAGVYSAEAIRDFDRVLAEIKPDIVHAHELYPLISPWILRKCTAAGIPVVYTCYDFRLTCPVATHVYRGEICHKCQGGREYWAVLRNCRNSYMESFAYASRSAAARRFRLVTDHVCQFMVLTEFSKRWLVDVLAVPDDRITVNPCSIPLPEKPVDPSRGEYIAFAGRFVPEKGVELLIEASRRTGFPVRLAGNASAHPAIRPGDPVECALTHSKEELATFYRNARMLVVPSRWYETFGIVAAEAMSHGIPVIASRIGALPYTVEEGVSGLLFDVNNVDDLIKKITGLWNDAALCRKLGEGGRHQVQERFNESTHFKQLTVAYERAILHQER